MDERQDLWVFGYGSLMWRPGFAYEEMQLALLEGYHRAFCVYSLYYRGKPDKPGLVLGLDPGGSCHGLAFRIAPANEAAVLDYLYERELCAYAYLARTLPVALPQRSVDALSFVADPAHRHYAGDLGLEHSARLIMEAEGVAGLNRDYLINTIRQLEAHGFADPSLHALLVVVERLTGEIEAGGGI